MDADLPSCERTACWGWFPRLFLDVLWLRASVIMPRSWLLDGFSTIRAHYSSLGLSCSSLHPSEHAHTHLYTLCGWTDGRWHMHTNAHIQYTNTNTEAPPPPHPRLKMAPPCRMVLAECAWRPVFGKWRRLGVGAKCRRAAGGSVSGPSGCRTGWGSSAVRKTRSSTVPDAREAGPTTGSLR